MATYVPQHFEDELRKYGWKVDEVITIVRYPSYPKSLGEVCLELAEDALLRQVISPYEIPRIIPNWPWPGHMDSIEVSMDDLLALRRLLYHKSEDPLALYRELVPQSLWYIVDKSRRHE